MKKLLIVLGALAVLGYFGFKKINQLADDRELWDEISDPIE